MEDSASSEPLHPLTSTITRRKLLINSGIIVGGAMLAGPLAACGATTSTGTTSSSPKNSMFGLTQSATLAPPGQVSFGRRVIGTYEKGP